MKIALVNEQLESAAIRRLNIDGFTVIPLPPDRRLSEAVCRHPDTLIARIGDNIITTAEYAEDALCVFSDIREYLPDIRQHFSSDERGDLYPSDVVMNILVMGKRAFGKCDSLSECVKDVLCKDGIELIGTRQGYPACTVLKLSDGAAITADRGMARILRDQGVNVTVISEGGILLPPHEYGFIGGASAVYNNKVYFFGDITTHKDHELIISTIEALGMEAVSLLDGELTDLGGIIFLE